MFHLSVWLSLALALVPPLAAAPTAPDLDAHRLLDEARLVLAGGHDVVPQRIEIDARYHYLDDERVIVDRTVIEPGRRLLQERQVDGTTIRRGWSREDAFLEGPSGRIDLDQAMRDDLEIYLCRRQLDFLILCPGAEASLVATSTSDRRLIEVRRDDHLLAELELDVESHRVTALRYPELIDRDESSDLGTAEVRFSEYRAVDGWMLPHHVEMSIDGEPRSSYSIERLVLATE
ncbi:MAG: hypothetical protein AAGE94_08670 [Acidobacteriota bacterium]